METKITATDLARSLSDVLSRVHYRRESFLIERNGEVVATLIPSHPIPVVSLRDVVARLGPLAMPGDGFADDLEAVQSSQPKAGTASWPN